jgi:hypothetical protein
VTRDPLPYERLVRAYIDGCQRMRGQLDPAYHPTADGAVKLIPHHGDHQAAEAIRATYTALTSAVIIHDYRNGPALTSLAGLPGWLAQRADPEPDPNPEPEPEPEDLTSEKAPPGLTIEAAARRYIERGWPVFVLGRAKRPVANCRPCHTAGAGHDRARCECLTCHGFYAATLDPARLAAMLATVRGGLLAIRTGRASGLCVVDIDPRNGGQLDRALMTPTATVATGGGGWQLYYRHPGAPTVPALPGVPGVDIKADGGYVVAPPSIHPGTGRPYRWAGDRPVTEMRPALRAAVARPAAPPVPAVPAPHGPVPPGGAGRISSPPALLDALLRAVREAPAGRRRVTLYGAARGVARMVAAGALTEADARAALTATGHQVSQPARDIAAAIDGAFTAEGVAAA